MDNLSGSDVDSHTDDPMGIVDNAENEGEKTIKKRKGPGGRKPKGGEGSAKRLAVQFKPKLKPAEYARQIEDLTEANRKKDEECQELKGLLDKLVIIS